MEDRLAARIFAVSGRNETRAEAFGALRLPEGWARHGFDWAPDLVTLDFASQVRRVGAALRREAWDREALVLGRSFGAWLVLNALLEQEEPHPGTVVLIASVLGYGAGSGLGFKAPRARAFWSEAEHRAGPPARRVALLHAADDEHCPCGWAERLSALWHVPLERFPHGGHALGKSAHADEVSSVIERWWREPGR